MERMTYCEWYKLHTDAFIIKIRIDKSYVSSAKE
jgi:hypothetical protein